jgi:GT2 family glycosyltransferase
MTNILLNSKKRLNISVVIATLGGGQLEKVINELNNGEYIPNEIIICIPNPEFSELQKNNQINIKYLLSPKRGQVFQRTFAFSQVNQKFVLQIDDDVFVDTNCILSMLSFLESHSNTAVSPSLIDVQNSLPAFFLQAPNEKSGFIYKVLFNIINGKVGYVPGKISKSGLNMGFCYECEQPYEVEWLPGGCLMMRKDNLIKHNYYPFSGKAYCEDLIHSHLLRQNGIKLFHLPKIVCKYDNSSGHINNVVSLYKLINSYTKSMLYFVQMTKKSEIRLFIYLFIYPFHLMIKKLNKF